MPKKYCSAAVVQNKLNNQIDTFYCMFNCINVLHVYYYLFYQKLKLYKGKENTCIK